MERIDHVIKQVLTGFERKTPTLQQIIQQVWEKATDEQIRKHSRIADYKKGKVFVMVDSPAWLYHLNNKKEEIVKRFKNTIPEIDTIILKIGKIR